MTEKEAVLSMEMNDPKEDTNRPARRVKPVLSLSKSLYIRGLQCHKSLYLEKFHRDLKGEVTAETQRLFDLGHAVGKTAQGLFPGGVLVPYIDSRNGISEQVRLTREAMERGAGTIYEASFEHDGIFVRVDILHKGKHGWEIHEVKAGTKLDPVYVDDVALQYYVVTGAGLEVDHAGLCHINKDYTRRGDLNVGGLFTSLDITGQVKESQPFVVEQLRSQRRMLEGNLPDIDIGPHCTQPYECDYRDHCWKHIPADSVFELRGRGVDPFVLYARGIVKQEEIPLDLLNPAQRQQVVATMRRESHIDGERIRDFLTALSYPLYLLDFETFMCPIPLFEGTRPYQSVPFQYSLHCLDREGGELRHREFLAEPCVDPRRPFLESLLAEVPEGACILAYNMSFEKGVLRELAAQFPEHTEDVERRIERIRDLMAPFRRRDIYLWKFKGSYSIKQVLPALVPELSYEGLSIADGGAAMDAYRQMCMAKDDPEKLLNIRRNLLDYCRLDTLAMVRILENLRKMI